MFRALREANLNAGDWAVFPGGGGGVGIQGVQLAKGMGLRPIVVDTGEAKRSLCLRQGAEKFIDFKTTADVAAAVVKAAGGIGAQGVFVTSPAAYGSAVSYVGDRVGAVVVCIGVPSAGTMELGIDPSLYIFKNLTVKGSLVSSRADTAGALDFARRGLLEQISSQILPLKQLPEAVEKLRKGQVAGRILIDFNID